MDGLGEFVFLVVSVVSRCALLRSACGFDDQRIDRIFREKRAFLQSAVFEVHIAGVHQAFAFAFDRDADRSEDVSSIVKGRANGAVGIEVEGALDAAVLERIGDAIDVAMIEERVFGDAEFDAFRLHDIDRVVKHGRGQLGGLRREVDPRALLLLKENRQGADMVEVRVGDDDPIDAVLIDKVVVRDCL